MFETVTNPTHPREPLTSQHDPSAIHRSRTFAHGSVDAAQSLAAMDPLFPTCKQMGDSKSSPPSLQPELSRSPWDELATEADFANCAFQAFLARTVGCRGYAQHEVADIVQDTNVVLIAKTRLGVVCRSALPTFAARTAINCGKAYLRRTRGRLVLGGSCDEEGWDNFFEQSLVTSSDPEGDLRASQAGCLVQLLVAAMPKRMRQVAEAAFFQELEYHEIQLVLKVSYHTVTTNLWKARARCKAQLESRPLYCVDNAPCAENSNV